MLSPSDLPVSTRYASVIFASGSLLSANSTRQTFELEVGEMKRGAREKSAWLRVSAA